MCVTLGAIPAAGGLRTCQLRQLAAPPLLSFSPQIELKMLAPWPALLLDSDSGRGTPGGQAATVRREKNGGRVLSSRHAVSVAIVDMACIVSTLRHLLIITVL